MFFISSIPIPCLDSLCQIIGISHYAAGPDTIITIEGPVEPTGPQEAQDIITSPEIVPLIRPQSEAREPRGVEIIKSMVYGGLLESITSLGIVSSAAGADASACKSFGFSFHLCLLL